MVDDHGRKMAVVIDLRKNRDLWEDFYDRLLVKERVHESRASLMEVKSSAEDTETDADDTHDYGVEVLFLRQRTERADSCSLSQGRCGSEVLA